MKSPRQARNPPLKPLKLFAFSLKVRSILSPLSTSYLISLLGPTKGSFPALQVTFNESMIFVGSVEEVNDPSLVPAKLTPQPKGRWRWTGTKTLSFQPEYKFPQSTQYTVKVRPSPALLTLHLSNIYGRFQRALNQRLETH